MTIEYVTTEELGRRIRRKEKLLVVDVRDDDYLGGHIKGSKNMPSRRLAEQLPQLVRESADEKTVVFHCMLSQVRGVKAARMYEEARRMMGYDEEAQKILILQGGFQEWQRMHGPDPELTAEWIKDLWD